jgi:hypothetical protein
MANKIKLDVSGGEGNVGYVMLPDHPGAGTPNVTKKQVRLRNLYPDYKGADLYFDFDENNTLLGIEILV